MSLPTRFVLEFEFNNFFTSFPVWMKQLTNAFLLRYFNGYTEEGLGFNFPISGEVSRIWLTNSNGYTLHVIGVKVGAHISVNRTEVKFVGYQNQL